MVNVPKLKGRMVEKNLTQEDVAKIWNVNVSTVNRKLNDSTGKAMNLREAMTLIHALGIKNSQEIEEILFDGILH